MKTARIIVTIAVILAVAYLAFLAVKNEPPETEGWNTYEHNGRVGFAFKYPAEWDEPIVRNEERKDRLIFAKGLVIEAGKFFNTQLQRNTTVEEAVQNDISLNQGQPENTTTTIDGIIAQKVTFTIPQGFLGNQDGNPIPATEQNIIDIFLQKNKKDSPIIFIRYSAGSTRDFDNILESFSLR